MKVSSYQVDRTIGNLSQYVDLRCILLYGPDFGVAEDRLRTLEQLCLGAALQDDFRNLTLTGEQLKADPAALATEFFAISMFGEGRKVIKVKNADNDLVDSLLPILQVPDNSGGNLVILLAGDLKPAAKLRKLCEENDYCLALPCYADEEKDTSAFVRKYVNEHGFHIGAEDMSLLLSVLGNNRPNIRQELDKVFIFLGNRTNTIQFAEIKELLSNGNSLSIGELSGACADLCADKINQLLTMIFQDGTSPVMVIRMLYNYFTRLLTVRLMSETAGLDLDTAIDQLQPKVFFKELGNFRRHVQRWQTTELLQLLDKLVECELQCKDSSYDAEIMLSHLLNVCCVKFAHH